MLARYPKLEATAHIRGSASESTSPTVCPILPRLCIGHTDNSNHCNNERGKDEVVDWSPDRGCDSAPVVPEDRRESSRFFALGDHLHQHHYPRCHCLNQRIQLQDDGDNNNNNSYDDDQQQHHHQQRLPSDDKQGNTTTWKSLDCESRPLQLPSLEELAIRTGNSSSTTTTFSVGSVIPSGVSDAITMDVSPEEDFKRLSRCVDLLHTSGYYYEGLSWQQATLKLRRCKVGTFLVRESENANYLFTLSVQTKKGPTSVRIAYKGGQFRLDSDEDLISRMPTFDTVTDLVEHYVKISKETQCQKAMSCCWLDLAGECSAPVELYSPLYKQVHSLKHLCRLTVVKQLRKCSSNSPIEWTLERSRNLCLPMALKEYIKEYPLGH